MSTKSLAASTLQEIVQSRSDLYDQGKNKVAFENMVWRLPGVARSRVLNWGLFGPVPREIAEAIVAFMRFNVSTKSTDHCSNVFRELVRLREKADRPTRSRWDASVLARAPS